MKSQLRSFWESQYNLFCNTFTFIQNLLRYSISKTTILRKFDLKFFSIIILLNLFYTRINAADIYVNDGSILADVFTSAIGNDVTGDGSMALPFRTIQHAIDLASDWDVIWVDSGTYDENISVHRELEIYGAGQGLTFVIPAMSDPAGGSLASVIFRIQANEVLIHDLTVDGKNPGITLPNDIDASTGIITDWTYGAGEWTDLEVYNVTVKDVYFRGMEATFNLTPNNQFYFHDNIIDGVQGDPGGASIGIFNYGDQGGIDGNTVSNCTNGIYTNESFGTDIFDNKVTGISDGTGIESDNNGEAGGASLEDLISGNKVTGGANGIVVFQPYLVIDINEDTVIMSSKNDISVLGGPGSVSIYDNVASLTAAEIGVDIDGGTADLSDNDINSNGLGGGNGIGVLVTNGGLLIAAFDNFIKNNTGDGIQIATDGSVGIGIFDNDLSGNTGFAINNLCSSLIYASCNWYGSKDPTMIASKINGMVMYTNWLTSGVDDEPGTPGFQEEANSCNGNVVKNTRTNGLFSTIEDAIADGTFMENDELTIPGCDYPACITINKSVKITATGDPLILECVIIDGLGINFTLGNDLTIYDLTLTNGKIHTQGHNISCGSISGGTSTNYIVTD